MGIDIRMERPDAPDAVQLISELDEALHQHDYPEESRHAFSVEKLIRDNVYFFVTRVDGKPAGCGGIKYFDSENPAYGEVKRMFVRPEFRGQGLGRVMLHYLEEHAGESGISLLRLETGIYQTDAIRLYDCVGFTRRGPFGDYKDDPNSVYFEKSI